MKLVVASYYDEILAPVIRGICDKKRWEVCDWFVAYPSQNATVSVEKLFPSARLHLPMFASRGLLTENQCYDQWPAIDQSIIDKMASHEHMFMRMLDIYDPTGRAFTSRERREAYFSLLRFGLYILQSSKPDLYIAGTIPHALHDYILYGLCRVLGVKTVFYMPVSLPGYLVLNDSIENGSLQLRNAYRRRLAANPDADVKLPEFLENYYIKMRSPYEFAEPWYVKLRNHSFMKKKKLASFLPNLLDRSNYARKWAVSLLQKYRTFITFLAAPVATYQSFFVTPIGDFFKREGVSLRNSETTRYQMKKIFRRGSKAKKALYREYLKRQSQPDFNLPFIFVPLHYQPEASTSPLGGAFVDQILMIKLLVKCMPKGWNVYVKEHRTTFDPGLRGDFARDLQYYKQISEIESVQLVPLEYTSFDFIDQAALVATVTGTAGWEAVLRGVPSMTFGNAWYKDCHGVFDGRDEARCREAMRAVELGFKPDQKKIRQFIKTITETGVWADRDNDYVLTDLDTETNKNILIDHFVRSFPTLFEDEMQAIASESLQ